MIDVLPEFLRAKPLMKKVTLRLATRESNSDLNIDLCDWKQRGELFYKGSILYITEVEAIRIKVLKKHHDELFAGHLPTKKTYNTLRHKYFWPNIYKQVDAYCTPCLICQGARVIFGKKPGELQSLLIPTKVWDVFSKDFITGLPERVSYGVIYDAILVVVNKLSKMCHYIPCCSEMTVEKWAEVITQEVIRLHWIPSAIISDRGLLFNSQLSANKPLLLFPHWATTQYSILHTDWPTKKETEQRFRTLFTQLFQLPAGWLDVFSSTNRIFFPRCSSLFN